MAGKKAFDVRAAVDAATLVFWDRGYGGASLAELKAATGLGAGSFYNAFRSKQALFVDCLEAYGASVVGRRIEQYLDVSSGTGSIPAFFRSAFYDRSQAHLRRGCFLVKIAAELGPRDRRARAAVSRWWGRLEDAFAAALTDTDGDGRSQARALLAGYQGLILLGMAGAARHQLLPAAEAIVSRAQRGSGFRG